MGLATKFHTTLNKNEINIFIIFYLFIFQFTVFIALNIHISSGFNKSGSGMFIMIYSNVDFYVQHIWMIV